MRFSTIAVALAGICEATARDPRQLRGVSNKLVERLEQRQSSARSAVSAIERAAPKYNGSNNSPYLTKLSQSESTAWYHLCSRSRSTSKNGALTAKFRIRRRRQEDSGCRL